MNAPEKPSHALLVAELADLENLFAATDVGTIFLDRQLRIRKFTPKVGAMFHLLPGDVGRRIDGFAHTLDYADFDECLTEVLESEEEIERQVRDRHGSWFLLRIIPYRVHGHVDGLVVSLVDITKLRIAEGKLRLMSKVFMDGADPIIIEDLDGRILDANEEAVAVYGFGRDELVGRKIQVLIPHDLREESRRMREQCLEEEQVRNIESQRWDKSGNLHPILLTMFLLYDESDVPVAIATIAKDITQRKRAEREARRAVERRDDFLAMLSHELRNPMAAAQNAAQLIQASVDDPRTLAHATEVILRQTRQMSRLLDDLLDVSRVTRGKVELRTELVDLRDPAQEAAEAVSAAIRDREQNFVVDLPSDPVTVRGDRARLRQIQENLLVNATKYTQEGGTIRLTVSIEGDDALVTVQDDGVGLEREQLESIFELFAQEKRTLDRADGGMGVGLTLVKSLTDLHHGRVEARSKGRGEGSEFTVRLPKISPAVEAAARPHSSAPAAAPEGRPRSILVVEDNDDAREMMVALLKLDGFDVRSVADGKAAVESILAMPPDVALVDIGLPGLDGYQVAARVRHALAADRVRLVALTGYGRREDRQAVREAGFDAHLVKPADREALWAAIAPGVVESS